MVLPWGSGSNKQIHFEFRTDLMLDSKIIFFHAEKEPNKYIYFHLRTNLILDSKIWFFHAAVYVCVPIPLDACTHVDE